MTAKHPPPPPARLVRKAEHAAREAARAPVGSLERALEDYDSAILATAIQCAEHPRDLPRIAQLNRDIVVPARTQLLVAIRNEVCKGLTEHERAHHPTAL